MDKWLCSVTMCFSYKELGSNAEWTKGDCGSHKSFYIPLLSIRMNSMFPGKQIVQVIDLCAKDYLFSYNHSSKVQNSLQVLAWIWHNVSMDGKDILGCSRMREARKSHSTNGNLSVHGNTVLDHRNDYNNIVR